MLRTFKINILINRSKVSFFLIIILTMKYYFVKGLSIPHLYLNLCKFSQSIANTSLWNHRKHCNASLPVTASLRRNQELPACCCPFLLQESSNRKSRCACLQWYWVLYFLLHVQQVQHVQDLTYTVQMRFQHPEPRMLVACNFS